MGVVTLSGPKREQITCQVMRQPRSARGCDNAQRRQGHASWCGGAAAPPSVAGLTFFAWQQAIGCSGVAIFPDDVIVADQDGAVVIPQALLESIVELSKAQEDIEGWIMSEVEAGAALPGLYPPNAENLARYQATKPSRG